MSLYRDNDQFYNSKRWRRHAAAILSRYNYLDQVQKRYGRLVPATMVHHALPLEQYPQYAYADFNLIPVSRSTHRTLHNDDGTLTRAGAELAARVARRAGVDFRQPVTDRRHQGPGRARHYATSQRQSAKSDLSGRTSSL